MAEPHVIGALREKRSELGGVIEQLEQRLEQAASGCFGARAGGNRHLRPVNSPVRWWSEPPLTSK